MEKITFSKAKWIWESGKPERDEYIDLEDSFKCAKSGRQLLKISADSNYAVWINGVLCDFGQYSDYVDDKIGDTVDVSEYINAGKNTIKITVWYYGRDCANYLTGPAGLIYELSDGDDILSYSSENSMVRIAEGYVSHENKQITVQLGYAFKYDSCDTPKEYGKAFVQKDRSTLVSERPIKKTVLCERTDSQRLYAGTFEFQNMSDSLTEEMMKAKLTFIRAESKNKHGMNFDIESDNGDPVYCVIDIGREESGFLDFDITVPEDCEIDIAYGEHLLDGRIRTHKRNFTCVYKAHKGRNTYMNPFRRLGCRYLEVYINAKSAHIGYVGIRPVNYPVNDIPFVTGNVLRDRIIEVCKRTLLLCMHEHYEDCPWREQAVYTMDSRNQALCGYAAFGEKDFPRASFRLIGEKLRPDGMMKLTAPANDSLTIPSFNLVYFIEMNEYIKNTGDTSLAEELYTNMETIMQAFLNRKRDNGLYLNFTGNNREMGYWGFFEWSETLDGVFYETEEAYECPLNAFLVLALRSFSEICKTLGHNDSAKRYAGLAYDLTKEIREKFYVEKDGLFKTFIGKHEDKYSVLNNALCVLCGAADGIDTTVIEKILKTNDAADTGLYIIPVTLSMFIYRFDALLKISQNYGSLILDEIDRTYLFMLEHGATTFWETLKGAEDFEWVGSLCHGWSALPIYYYKKLLG